MTGQFPSIMNRDFSPQREVRATRRATAGPVCRCANNYSEEAPR